MQNAKLTLMLTLSAVTLSACTLAPKYVRPAPPVASQWPIDTPTTADVHLKWRDLFLDKRLQSTIDLAIAQNRDLRVAALNIDHAQAQYRIQRSALLPAINASGTSTRNQTSDTYSANLGLAAYEVDLFGRVRSLKDAALESFFAERENRNAVQISLIAAVAQQWLTLAADQDALRLAKQTQAGQLDTLKIAEGRARIGVLSDLDLNQITVQAETARADVARLETVIDQDKAALTLLVGAPLTPDLLPDGLTSGLVIDALPVGLPSDVLLARPDVLTAEHDLKSANANIGAARAAFFPRITLTGSTGSSSSDLDGLFKSGTNTWSFSPAISVPIFAGGANRAGLDSAKINRDIAVAQYEKAIQSAFSDVSDALAVRSRIDERLSAQTAATNAASRSLTLSQARYDTGSDSYLVLLDAQRTLYSAQQTLISLQALRATNLVALYRALGDDTSLN
ncbi:efflux transporter outer membrane subunit [Asticcacaulis sp. 201]|uniref:efflux transporter outer membrane subunit n=1 Tax=Asticcacaulis sp. 201 TaxID=3028787 RepID=UPI00291629D7|nr:efflux transporter outer membrane subunit [Asticcacaulis sp. 201]MDV6331031.1 efflux transporter outer membrane subunit [Asticcacaulis sp. 201]